MFIFYCASAYCIYIYCRDKHCCLLNSLCKNRHRDPSSLKNQPMASYFLISGARAALNEREAPGKVVTSVPSKPKKMALSAVFWTPADKNFEYRHLRFWTQFPSLEKISQNTISLFFQRCTGHIFTIEAVLRSQHRKFRRILEILCLQSL